MIKAQNQFFTLEAPSNFVEGIKWYVKLKTRANGYRTDERIKSISNILLRTIKKMGIDNMPIQNVNAGVITQLLVRTKKDRGFSNTRFNDYHSFLNTCFREFFKNDWIKKNPLINVDRRRKEDPEKHTPYTETEYERIKDYFIEKEPFLWSFIEFMCHTGLRPNEIRQMKVGDIDTENWLVRLRSSIAKTGKERIIKIRSEYRPTINEWCLDLYPKKFFLFSNKSKGIGEKMAGKNAFSMKFFEHRPYLNVTENHTLYGFRHTMALRILENNNHNLKKVQKYLGHTSLKATFNYLQKAYARQITDDSVTVYPVI
ncbi:tyrosine-type recombinase/integrase [Bernardetia sp. OM2101]|uniref:tyrosine-type recombinase/integrase n=1 Tax=Bernardetia sp. OM2101 TaxID=3344876 RepID=UPI0035D0B932